LASNWNLTSISSTHIDDHHPTHHQLIVRNSNRVDLMRLIAVECWSAMLKTDSSWKRHQMSWSIDQKWVHHALGHEFWWGQRSWTQIWDLDGSSWKIAGTSSTLQFFMLVEMILSWYMLDLDIFHASWCDFWADSYWTWTFFMRVDAILIWYMMDLDIFHASWCDFWADSYWTWSFFMLVRWFWVWHRDCDRNFRDFHIWYRSIAEIAMIILIPYVKKWILDIELTKIWSICDGNAQKHGWVSMKLSDFRWNCDEFE